MATAERAVSPPSLFGRYLQRLYAIESTRASLQEQLAAAEAEAEEAAAEHATLEEGAKASYWLEK